jgi:hypothetical protein
MFSFSSRAGYANALAGNYIDHASGTRRASAAPRMVTPESQDDDQRKAKYPGDQSRKHGICSNKVTLADEDVVLGEDDIIIITVKITKKERRNSYDDPLPERCASTTVYSPVL